VTPLEEACTNLLFCRYMPTCETPPTVLKNTRSPSFSSVLDILLEKLNCSRAVLGRVTPYKEVKNICMRAEQSMPSFVLPPNLYLVPIHSSITRNMAR